MGDRNYREEGNVIHIDFIPEYEYFLDYVTSRLMELDVSSGMSFHTFAFSKLEEYSFNRDLNSEQTKKLWQDFELEMTKRI